MTRNKKIAIGITLIAIAIAGYWLAAPLFIDKKVNESMDDIKTSAPAGEEAMVISMGNFMGADDFHKGEGTVKLIKVVDKYFVRFEDDFKVTNGPDLFVHFGENGEYAKEARIGLLKGNIGGQNYEVPAGIDPLEYSEIWIWCRAFSTPFAKAVLSS